MRMLTIKYEQEANKNEARLETGKALMDKSGRKYQKNTLISSIDNAKVSSEKVLSSPSNFFVKSDLQKSNKQLNNYQTQHVKEKSGAEKVKGSGMLEFLEKKNPPVVEDVFFPNKQKKEVQNTQKSEKEIILASGKSSLTKTVGSQFDSVKDQEKIEQEVEKKIEASHTQNPEKIILTEVKNRKQKNIASSIIAPSGKEMKINALKIPSAPKNSITKPSSSHNPINTNKKLKNTEKFSVNDAKSREDLTKEVRVEDKTFIENAINKNNDDLMIREKSKKLELDASDMKEKLNVNENLKKSENEIKNQKEIYKSRNASNLLKFEEPNSSSSNKPPNEFKDLAEKRANPISDGAPKVSTESFPGAIIKSPENNIESALPSSGNTLEKSDRAKQDQEKTPIFSVKNKLNNSKSEAKEVFSNKELKAQPKSVPPIAYVKFNKNEDKGLLEVENRSIEGGDFLERRPGKTILIEESDGTLIGGQNPFKTKKTNYQNIELSLDYLLNENLRSTIKLHKYGDEKIKFKNFGFWNGKIKEYFLDYEKVLKTWMEKDFNPHIMIHMGIILGSKYANEVHAPIEVCFGSEMERFLDSFLRDPLKYKNAENWYIKYMPRFEGQRRILALRKQIQQYVVSKKWLAIMERTQGYPVQTDEILGIEKQFTINLCESEILLRDDLFEDGKFHQPIPAIVKEAFGEEEALRRVKLLEFLKYRNSPHKWWRDQQDYDNLNLKNGVDFHKALKVADILQFGWYSFADSTSWGRMTIDEAFFSFMDVLKSSKNSIPWKESPERNWLISCKNENYFEKLIIFATHASEKQNLISEKIAKDPRRLDDWKKMFNRSIKDFKKISLGDTIIWWDLGHKPQMLFVIEERVEPILEHLKNGWKHKFQESWKLLMRNVDIRSMVIDYCTFFHRNLDESTEKQLQNIVLGEILEVKEGKITAENSQIIIKELSGLVEYHKNIPLSTQILNYLYDYAYIVARTMFR
ncbi:hypothetical protein BY996DRAFT_2208527 [Phakopsora pachyrhizi]|nr:hypothetical protein BY996DRAFT_2208527 [Phakopsora pachyrhizi]